MSIERIGDKYQIDGNSEVIREKAAGVQEEISLFESEEAEEINDYETEFGQFNKETASANIDTDEAKLEEELIEILNNLINEYEKKLNEVKDNNGVIAKGWDWIKNKTGIGAGSDKIQKQIEELREEVAGLKDNPERIAEVYKDVTGNELNEEELMKLADGTADFSKSEIVESVSKYVQGQKQSVNIISGIASGLAVVGMLALAPFTGGLSLAGLGAATLVGTAAYMVPQAVDGLTEKDGYSPKEIAQDIANGVINSGFTAIGMGAGKAVGKIAGKSVTSGAGKFFANLAVRETALLVTEYR